MCFHVGHMLCLKKMTAHVFCRRRCIGGGEGGRESVDQFRWKRLLSRPLSFITTGRSICLRRVCFCMTAVVQYFKIYERVGHYYHGHELLSPYRTAHLVQPSTQALPPSLNSSDRHVPAFKIRGFLGKATSAKQSEIQFVISTFGDARSIAKSQVIASDFHPLSLKVRYPLTWT